MTRALPRTHFHSSTFIRCLADLALVDAAAPGKAFAEQLGQWIHFADAIALSGVHGEGVAHLPGTPVRGHAAASAKAGADLDRVRALLADGITKSFSPKASRAHITLPLAEFEAPMDIAKAYAPYRRFYEAHQRDMELGIQPLRVNAREAVAKASPKLRKLAELDAAMERILRERESKLLAKVPVLLRKRFEQLFSEHQQKLAAAQQADQPEGWMQAGGWLAQFCKDMHMLLLAELELRLQPAMGLIEALKQDTQ